MDLRQFDNLILFGGTFDPPQVAHVKLPMVVRERVGADAVVYVPAAVSPFKVHRQPTPAEHRLAMLRLALRDAIDAGRAMVLEDEVRRGEAGEPSYTIDTIESLRDRMREDATLRLLIGSDLLRDFERWKDWRRIIALAKPLVMVRPPDTYESVLAALPAAFGRDGRGARIVDVQPIDVSSTNIRRHVAAAKAIGAWIGFVDPAVEQYIREHGLYREKTT